VRPLTRKQNVPQVSKEKLTAHLTAKKGQQQHISAQLSELYNLNSSDSRTSHASSSASSDSASDTVMRTLGAKDVMVARRATIQQLPTSAQQQSTARLLGAIATISRMAEAKSTRYNRDGLLKRYNAWTLKRGLADSKVAAMAFALQHGKLASTKRKYLGDIMARTRTVTEDTLLVEFRKGLAKIARREPVRQAPLICLRTLVAMGSTRRHRALHQLAVRAAMRMADAETLCDSIEIVDNTICIHFRDSKTADAVGGWAPQMYCAIPMPDGRFRTEQQQLTAIEAHLDAIEIIRGTQRGAMLYKQQDLAALKSDVGALGGTGHSIKRSATTIATDYALAVDRVRLIPLVPLLDRHAHTQAAWPDSTVRYVGSIAKVALAMGTQELTCYL
jgi:hypothetical protein